MPVLPFPLVSTSYNDEQQATEYFKLWLLVSGASYKLATIAAAPV